MRVIIDRFEEEYVVCEKEDKTTINILKKNIPFEVKENDILLIDGDNILLEEEQTKKRKDDIEKLTKKLWKL